MTPIQARMARAALHLSLRDLAEQCGLSAMALSKFEQHGTGISAATAEKLEAFYRDHRVYCGPRDSVSIDQDALAQERFMAIALTQILKEAGITPTSTQLIAAYDRAMEPPCPPMT